MSAEPIPAPAVTPPRAPSPRRRRRLRWMILGLLLLFVLGGWFAPTVVAHTGLRNELARKALADLKGSVEVGGASLGWFSPIELRDVVLKDAEDRVLLTAPKVTSSKTLLALARDRSDLGEFTVEGPSVEVVCAKQSTNLEEALATYLKDVSPPAPSRPTVAVRVTGGRLTIRDADTGTVSAFEQIDAAASVPASRADPVAVKLRATSGGTPAGVMEAEATIGESGQVRFFGTNFPLDSLAAAVRRVEPGASVAGRLTADLVAEWGKDPSRRPKFRVEGKASGTALDLAGPWLNGDRLRLASAELPVKLEVVGRHVRVERAELRCDAGTLSAVGSFDPDEPLDRLLDKDGVKVEADVDLARLAALLPRLLRVREGTAMKEGRLTAKLASRSTPGGTTWDGEVRASGLKAERDGKPFEWAEPLAVEFSGRLPAGQLPTFDKLVCRSDFLAVNAQGSPEAFRAAANVYLDRLTTHLGEFVDLGGVRLGGEASAWVIAKRSPQGEFKANGAVELKQFEFADRTGPLLTEGLLKLQASAAGHATAGGPVRLDQANLVVVAGTDELDLSLTAPIPDARQPGAGSATVRLVGDVGRWRSRVGRFVHIPRQYLMSGAVNATGTARVDPGRLTVERLAVTIDKARFRGAGLDIDEPTIAAAGELHIDRKTGSAAFTTVRLTSAVLNLSGATLTVESGPGGDLAVGGQGNAVADLNRLARTLKLSTDPHGRDALHGRATGPVRFRWHGDTTTFAGTLDVKDFAGGPREKPDWAEPWVKVEADGRYDEKSDSVTLTKARFERTGLAVEAHGTVAKLDTSRDAKLNGTLTYDLAKLTPDLRATLGGGFSATGQGSRPFALAGSLNPPAGVSPFGRLTADASLGWDRVHAYGFDAGPGELKGRLAGGVLTANPVTASFGGGSVTVAPTVRLDPAAELSFARGKIIDRAKLTPAACAGAIGYALPVIANAANAEGDISVTLEDNRVPLADPTKATARGSVLVHKAKVSAGPVVGEVAKLLGAGATEVVLANEMTVPVRIENGRVHHENLTLTVNGFVVRTAGSVGFDGSLALVADVPVPASLLKNNPTLAKALAGKTVKVPLAGTLSAPVVDQRHFQNAVAELTRAALKDVGKDSLNKELEKLFPGGGMPGPGFPFPPKK